MRAYLGQLCGHLAEALRDVRPIAVKVDAPEVHLPSEQAVALGLIGNELVTNSRVPAKTRVREIVARRGMEFRPECGSHVDALDHYDSRAEISPSVDD